MYVLINDDESDDGWIVFAPQHETLRVLGEAFIKADASCKTLLISDEESNSIARINQGDAAWTDFAQVDDLLR
ncbi:MAG: hypothetical protein ABJ327_15555 [Litoreibacter sp.]